MFRPVLDSFLWMKWNLVTKYFNRTLRLHFLLLLCTTWYFFMHFGGYHFKVNHDHKPGGENNSLEEGIRNKSYCLDVDHEFPWSYWNTEDNQVQNRTSYLEIIATNAFTLAFLVMFIWLLKDAIAELFQLSIQHHFVAFWIDCVNTILCIMIFIYGSRVLWLVITILCIFYTAR